MATDATGVATSPDNIPTYNPSVDAPSGLGFNAAMAAIQTALSARAKTPAGIASGEAMVWNGTTFVRSSATNIGPTSLGSGTPDATKFLRGDGSWQVPAVAGGMTLICDSLLGGAQASFDTNTILGGNIPATYKHLHLRLSGRGDAAATGVNVNLRLNADAGANYDYQYINGSGASASAAASAGVAQVVVGGIDAATGPANYAGLVLVDLTDYASATFYKNGIASGYNEPSSQQVGPVGFTWKNTAAITRIQLLPSSGNFAAGTRFSLYGLA